MRLLLGDCLDKLKELDENSIDSIVTDPPYGLAFMGKKWDYDVPSIAIWQECFRVLKPGGHLLAFAGSRTYHRMAVRIEDAGFEIRDQIMWLYGSGFPKSLNIGKGVDKKLGNQREIVGENPNHRILQETNTMCGEPHSGDGTLTKGNTPYEGWGTALKPAHEPIVMARKPLSEKTVVDNVLKWGTGGINIDDSRISTNEVITTHSRNSKSEHFGQIQNHETYQSKGQELGRFPANIILDKEAGKILDEQSGITKSGNFTQKGQSSNTKQPSGWKTSNRNFKVFKGDSGGASRFFYCPKASKKDRNEGLDELESKSIKGRDDGQDKRSNAYKARPTERKNIHPTVKPTDLMLYLIRLVTPKGKTTLDPFMGSGSTGKAAIRGGFNFIGIERELEYYNIAKARIEYETQNEKEKQKPDPQQKLF